jgi:hypothetical protein
MSKVFSKGIDYAPFKMAYFEFENYHYLIVSGSDAQLHIYKVNLQDNLDGGHLISVEDATAKFFENGKCEFDSDVLHIHVDHIESDHYIIAIATEFGQIKVFEVKNYSQKNNHSKPQSQINTKSEFREYLSGNISSNICKI